MTAESEYQQSQEQEDDDANPNSQGNQSVIEGTLREGAAYRQVG
jgi:hypothetical protein